MVSKGCTIMLNHKESQADQGNGFLKNKNKQKTRPKQPAPTSVIRWHLAVLKDINQDEKNAEEKTSNVSNQT